MDGEDTVGASGGHVHGSLAKGGERHPCMRKRERERQRSEIANKSVQVLASASLTGIKYLSNHSVSVTEKQPV